MMPLRLAFTLHKVGSVVMLYSHNKTVSAILQKKSDCGENLDKRVINDHKLSITQSIGWFSMSQDNNDYTFQQGCIPVGCILPACNRTVVGVSLIDPPKQRPPLDRDPPGQRPPPLTETPGQRPPPLGQRLPSPGQKAPPPGQRPPGQTSPWT